MTTLPAPPMAEQPEWMTIARQFNGIRETVNGKLNPQIVDFFQLGTHFPLAKLTATTPWCAAFVSYCLHKAGMKSPLTANAAACALYGLPVVGEVQHGDVVVLAPGVQGAGTSGHVGFYLQPLNAHAFWLYSGNCANTVKASVYQLDRVVAWRRPVAG